MACADCGACSRQRPIRWTVLVSHGAVVSEDVAGGLRGASRGGDRDPTVRGTAWEGVVPGEAFSARAVRGKLDSRPEKLRQQRSQ